jgi:hypothetical protein
LKYQQRTMIESNKCSIQQLKIQYLTLWKVKSDFQLSMMLRILIKSEKQRQRLPKNHDAAVDPKNRRVSSLGTAFIYLQLLIINLVFVELLNINI